MEILPNTLKNAIEIDDKKPISQTVFMLSIAINRVEHVCTTVSMVHSYMLMCNHKIVINIMLCLLYSTRHNAYRELYSTSSPKMSCEKGIL